MERPLYVEYLKSDMWQRVADIVRRRQDERCMICNANGRPLEVHHRSYRRYATPAELDDLIGVCSDCHRIIHQHYPREYFLPDGHESTSY